jgi:ABC-type branched-subunit amino acid transport system ATPase component
MNAGSAILELQGVTKHFGGLSVIENLSFAVARGSRTAMIGPNGAGKTTVFNLVSGVLSADAGGIFFDGRDISAVPSRRRVGRGIARSFQNVRLMPHLTALENVMVGQHSRCSGLFGILQPINLLPNNRWRAEARAALADAGLAPYESATVATLPYGVQKRVELVRAIMARPRLLLLDEPAAGLNSAESEALQQLLDRICADTAVTLLIIEHDMHFVGALCGHVVVLDFGRKIAEGTLAQIRDDPLVQRIYLGATAASKECSHAARCA